MKLKKSADVRTIAFVFIQLALIVLGYLLWASESWPLLALHVAATSFFAFITATIVHNTVHVPMFVERSHNKAAQLFLSIAFGHPVSVYVRGHNLGHHRFVQTERDVMRTTKARSRSNLLNQVFFFFIVGPALASANRGYAKKMSAEGSPWFRQFRTEQIVVNVFLLIMVLVDWRAAALFLGVPRLVGIWGIVGTNYFQHDGCDHEHLYNHSRTFTGRWVNWWTFNNGFHGMHHIDPSTHWSDLPAAHDAQLAPHVHPELAQPNIARWAWKFYISPGTRRMYDGRPYVLPAVGTDDNWMPSAHELPAGVSIGAVTADPA